MYLIGSTVQSKRQLLAEDIHARDVYERTPQHLAARNGHFTCLIYLMDCTVDLESKDDHGLHLSTYQGHLAEDIYGRTPLHLSAKNGHLKCLRYLIEKNADFNAKDTKGDTALHLSAKKGHFECLKYLVYKKAEL
jgi:hypothetical protein